MTATASVNSGSAKFGRPTVRDAIAGVITGLLSIPEGMAYASIGGINPVAGLYSACSNSARS